MKKNTFFDTYTLMADEKPEKVLLRIDDNELTYGRFMKETAVIGSGMKKLGINKDDKIGIVMPNSIEWYLVFWSAIRIGAQPVPIDPQSGSLELSRLIPATTIKMCFASEKYRSNNIVNALKELVPSKFPLQKVVCYMESEEKFESDEFITFEKFRKDFCGEECDIYVPEDDHIMSLACTSGSTGTPKVLSVPYYGFYQAEKDISDYLEFCEDDVMMIGMTLYHQGGFGMGLQNTVKGGTVMYQPQFNPVTFLETVQKYHVNVIQLTATLAKVLLSVPEFKKYDLSSVKVCYFAGEVLPREVADIFVNDLNIRVINVIGSSETATMVVWDSAFDNDTDPSDFRKLPFTDVRVLGMGDKEVAYGEVGELCIFTDAVITDYFGNPELSAEKIINENGKRWFRTGDLVRKSENGRVSFAGRSKRIIKRGGNLVHAEEVEAALLTHPKIAAAAVTAEDHKIIGQQIVAYVQLAEGIDKMTRGEIARYFDGKLSAYKLPDKVVVVEEIPKDIGKIQFKYLREKAKV